MAYNQVSLSGLLLEDMCLIIRIYSMEEVMVVIMPIRHLLEEVDMEEHLVEDLEERHPRARLEEEQ